MVEKRGKLNMATAKRIEPGTHEAAIAEREANVEEAKKQGSEDPRSFPLRIKQILNKPAVPGFFPWDGVKIRPGEVFYARTRDEARAFIQTGIVELVLDERDPLDSIPE